MKYYLIDYTIGGFNSFKVIEADTVEIEEKEKGRTSVTFPNGEVLLSANQPLSCSTGADNPAQYYWGNISWQQHRGRLNRTATRIDVYECGKAYVNAFVAAKKDKSSSAAYKAFHLVKTHLEDLAPIHMSKTV